VHRVSRADELAAQRAAHAAGIAPEIVHAEPGALVMRFVEGRTLAAADLRDPVLLARVATLLRRCHAEVARHLAGAAPEFQPFTLFRHYDRLLREARSPHADALDELAALAGRLAVAVGAQPVAFCHNDLLPANLIDDGARLWLLDWEYAGLNAPLFDAANLATNAGLDPAAEDELLRRVLDAAPGAAAAPAWLAMRCVSLLRETMWGMVAQATSPLALDYAAYVAEQLARLAAARARWQG